MKAATIHLAQQRSSCQGCRKQKARCQRIQPEDLKCARCMMHKIDCIGGRQKKIGRPQRAPTAAHDAGSARVHDGSATQHSNADARHHSSTPNISHHQSALVQNDATWDGFLRSPSSMGSLPPKAYGSPGTIDPTRHAWSSPGTEYALGVLPDNSFNLPLHMFDPESGSYSTSELDLAPQDTDITAYALTTLSQMNMDLHGRLQTADGYRDMLTLELITGQEGPLFINNITVAQFTLQVVHEFLSVLKSLQAGCMDKRQHLLLAVSNTAVPSSNPPSVELQTSLSLIITSIFKQILDLYDLNLSQVTPRLDRLETDPVAPFPGPRSETWQLVDACAQGARFVQIMHQLLNQTEKTLGITWGADHGDGLLSPRQMQTLWNEIGGELGYGLMRIESIKGGLKHANLAMMRHIDRRLR